MVALLPNCAYSNSCRASTTSDYIIGTAFIVVVLGLIFLANRRRKPERSNSSPLAVWIRATFGRKRSTNRDQ